MTAPNPPPPLVSVIIPTYREAENIPILVPQVANVLSGAGIQAEIVIVDDNSNDGTEAICTELAAKYPLRLEVRTTERGLSSAVLHGMRQAKGSIFVVMDADLSHPPEKIPELIGALATENTDFVIGSRYVAGAGTDENWGVFRWLNSKIATLLAWPLTSARDPMAGFFALRRATFEAADTLDPIGYKIGLELIVKCRCAQIKEVPITFRDRTLGQSKLSLKEQINYLHHLMRLYRHRYEGWVQLAQFLLVGGTGMVVDMGIFSLLLMALPMPVARALAIWVAMSWNFVLNRQVTFRTSRDRPMLLQYLLFCASCAIGAIVNYGTSVALVEAFDLYPLLAALIGIIAGTGFNFLFSKYHVFK